MMGQNDKSDKSDKAYYLTDQELALALSAKGMKELYGFRMKHIQALRQADIYKTLFELEKRKLLSLQAAGQAGEGPGITFAPELDRMLETIKNAERMLLHLSRQPDCPDQCIYLGSGAVFVSPYGITGSLNRLAYVSADALPEAVLESGFRIEELVNDESLFQEMEADAPGLQEEADVLFGTGAAALQEGEWGRATDCLKLISLKTRSCIRQYLLLREGLSDYFAVSDETGSRIYMYSRRKILKRLKADLAEANI